jgi:glycosyltransferase involved in cell wall biosynthesis
MTPEQSATRARDLAALEASGIFDAPWYAAAHADVGHAGVDPAEHFIDAGWKQGRAPNFYLDPAWYLSTYEDVRASGIDPVLHYILHGDAEGRQPGPWFDTAWYRTAQGLGTADRALPHYLAMRPQGVSPNPDFDAAFYLSTYRDVARAGADAFEHYVTIGWQEGREPHPDFDTAYYTRAHMGGRPAEAPLLHWLRHRHDPAVQPRMPQETPTIPREIRRNTRPGAHFERPVPLPDGTVPRAKVIAYYLPQFHAITENDTWWGTGFTEWTNLGRATPRFAGHYQPRIPRDLGHYNLGGPDAGAAVMRRQIAMAKSGGVHGFVFYWYWFNGHRLLEKPVEAFLADRSLDMPFALMWANENWTRRWDGAEADVLMSQDYRAEEEDTLIDELARHFADPRYIRLQGRPILTMYRAGLMPAPKDTVDGWRRRFRERHGEDPVFVMAQSFDDVDPRDFGFDGAIEFPPHKLAKRTTPISAALDYLDPDFTGTVFSYDAVVQASLEEPEPEFPLIKCAVPGWDNDPRKQGNGTVVIHGGTPASYEAWMAELTGRAVRNPFFGEPLVCVNAWNEWCEGAYLEPDLHFGAAFLNATARAVTAGHAAGAPRLLLAAADAADTEATTRLVDAARGLRRISGLDIAVLLLGHGPREEDFARVGPVFHAGDDLDARFDQLRAEGVRHALVASAAVGRLAAPLAARGIRVTVFAHEMPAEIRARDLSAGLRAGLRHAEALVVPAAPVQGALGAMLPLPARCAVVEPGQHLPPAAESGARAAAREEYGLKPGEALLLGAGPGDLQHGIDLFLHLFRQMKPARPELRAVWVGSLDPALRGWLALELAQLAPLGLRIVEALAHPGALLLAADVLALTAREDAAPILAQEAAAAGLPMVAFAGSGGGAVLAEDFGGAAVPPGDVGAMAAACLRLLEAPPDAAFRLAAHEAARRRFEPSRSAAALLREVMPDLPGVAVVVPGTGQGGLLGSRLDAVFGQDLPVAEVVLLDDPTDSRVAEGAARAAQRWNRTLRSLAPNPVIASAAAMALAETGAPLIWLVDPATAPASAFLRIAAASLASVPRAPAAMAGPGAVLWRRAGLEAALARVQAGAGGGAGTGAGIGAVLTALADAAEGALALEGVALRHLPHPAPAASRPDGPAAMAAAPAPTPARRAARRKR